MTFRPCLDPNYSSRGSRWCHAPYSVCWQARQSSLNAPESHRRLRQDEDICIVKEVDGGLAGAWNSSCDAPFDGIGWKTLGSCDHGSEGGLEAGV